MISFKIPLESWFSQDPLHYFPYSSSPHLMDTLRIWYLWKGIFKLHLGVVVSWHTNHFPRNTSEFTGTRPLTHIINIPAFHPRLPLHGPLPLSRFKSYSSSSSILGVLGRVLR